MKPLVGFALIALTAVHAFAQHDSGVGTVTIQGREFPYEVVDGLAVYAGDIILGTAPEVAAWPAGRSPLERGLPPMRQAVPAGYAPSGLFCIWRDGIIPYVIEDDVPEQARGEILQAIRIWDTQTVLRFVERTPQHEDYMRFTPGPWSGTWICGDGVNDVVVGQYASATVMLHHIGHGIGLAHENQRRDRDRYLKVFSDNISATQSGWHPDPGHGRDIGPYDYRSVMHDSFLSPSTKRNHSRPFMAETVPPGMPFGVKYGHDPELLLSPGDIDSVARLYGRIPSEHVISTNPPGLEIIVDGHRVTAPASFHWQSGSEHALEVPSPQFDVRGNRYLFGRWSDNGARSHTITATSDTTLYQASFIAQHRVSTPVRPPDAGSVNVSPASPDGYYTLRTPVELRASTTPGSAFSFMTWNMSTYYGWVLQEAVHGEAEDPLTTFVGGPEMTYEAVFSDGPIFRVESNVDPVAVDVDGRWRYTPVNLTPEHVGRNTTVTARLIESPQIAYRHRFRSWSDGGDLTHSIEVPQDRDTTLTLTLDTEYRLTTRAWQNWRGNEVMITPSSPDGFYPDGTEVRLLASPRPPAKFVGWNGDVAGRDPAVLVVMDDGRLAEAVFALDATELQPDEPVGVSLHGLVWDGTVPDFSQYYIQPPAGASHIEVEFRTRVATPEEAGLFVTDTEDSRWPDAVRQDTVDLVLRTGEAATITIPRPPKRWPAAYFILVRAAETDSLESSLLEGTLVVRAGGRSSNRSPQSRAMLEDRTLVGASDGPLVMDVAWAFTDPDGDELTYAATSSAETVATASAWGSTVTVTPVAVGSATIAVAATDTGGSNTTATRGFRVTVLRSFTDHPIVPGVTPVRAVHFAELRQRINALRERLALGRVSWTDAVLRAGVTPVKLVHLSELRAALTEAYAAAGRTVPSWTDAAPVARVTPLTRMRSNASSGFMPRAPERLPATVRHRWKALRETRHSMHKSREAAILPSGRYGA